MENIIYNKLNEYLKSKYNARTLKICIDGGFTCPNRDGLKSTSGCIFCSNKGSGDHLKNIPIKTQVENYFKSDRSKRAKKYIVYFQNYTNTYDSIQNLKEKYDQALINNNIVVLAIATRPDCITEEVAKLISSYQSKVDTWIELGLQTSNDEIGEKINRKYTSNNFTNAVKILNNYNIDVIAHIMIGLPGETKNDIINITNFINNHDIQGIKIHSTYIVENTVLNQMYESKEYIPIELDYYIENTCYILTHLNPNIVIHKLSGDAPKDILVAPEWNRHKKWIMNGIENYMRKNNLYQGMYYKK